MSDDQTAVERLWQFVRDRNLRTMMDHLGIEMITIGKDLVSGSMPVDHRTIQYFGILHGGASVALAETLASCAAAVNINLDQHVAVGLEINANHLRSVRSGKVIGEARPIHIGKKTHVWGVEIRDEQGKMVCVSRCTLAIIDKPALRG